MVCWRIQTILLRQKHTMMDISKELHNHFNHFNKDTLNTDMFAIT